jgi:hypothetical protein
MKILHWEEEGRVDLGDLAKLSKILKLENTQGIP